MSREPKDGVQVFHGEVAVFVEKQQTYGDNDRQAAEELLQAGFFGLAHPFDQEEVGHGGGDKLYNEFRCSPCVEDERCQQQHIVPDLPWYKEIDQEEGWHEIEEENITAEYHGFLILCLNDLLFQAISGCPDRCCS